MSDEAITKPTLETVLERIDALGNQLRGELQEFRASVETRLEEIETRLDRTQGITLETRADVRELRKELRAHLSQFNQPT